MGARFGRLGRVVVDLLALTSAFWFAFLFYFDFRLTIDWVKVLFFTWPYVVLFQYLVLVAAGIPRMAWRYVSVAEARRILLAVVTAQAVLVGLSLVVGPFGGYARFVALPVGILLIDLALAFLAIAGVRVLRRMQFERWERRQVAAGCSTRPRRTLLLGAGRAGMLVAREIAQRPDLGIVPVGFVDDDPQKRGTVIQGIPVVGDMDGLGQLAHRLAAEQALITIASASRDVVARMNHACGAIQLPVKIIPAIYDILDGRLDLGAIREVTIDDLLGREAVKLDEASMSSFLAGHTVMVTGAGGSIGSELCRQIVRFAPERLLLVEQAEPALFSVHQELCVGAVDVVPCVADVSDRSRLARLFHRYHPHVVFHAAAHKHVPMMEWNPGEAVKNNVFGTQVVADLADRYGVERFVLISTDKAVNPTSIMGATKRVAEVYIQALAQRSQTRFVAVRFGNVLGSAGSVIPIFREQIRKGGPVTVTHPEMSRYFMTIPEACQLVMEAGALGKGGETFVLDMGDPVRILTLARDMIRLSGYTEDDIGIVYSGPRPGEKLFEEFSVDTECMSKTRHPKIYIGRIGSMPYEDVLHKLHGLTAVVQSESATMVRIALSRLVPELGEPLENTLDEIVTADDGQPLFH